MSGLALGIDLGGTQVRAALLDEAGTLLARAAQPTDVAGGPRAVFAQMQQLVQQVCHEVGLANVPTVGVGSPGPLDAQTGVVLNIPTLPGWVDIPLVAWLRDWLGGKPVTLSNDGVAAAVGEWQHGAARGLQDFVYMTVSTGIGGGVIADGRVLRGRRWLAAHLGHMVIDPAGPRCLCGNPGCWEALASGTAMGARAREAAARHPESVLAQVPELAARHVFEAAAQGDALALQLVADEARWLGAGIVSLLHLFSPAMVVMGGGVAQGFEQLHPGIRSYLDRNAMPAFREVPVVRAALGNDSGLVGAAAIARMALADEASR